IDLGGNMYLFTQASSGIYQLIVLPHHHGVPPSFLRKIRINDQIKCVLCRSLWFSATLIIHRTSHGFVTFGSGGTTAQKQQQKQH
ncbi:MAG: hypothetical protein QGF90_04920, partial [Gammaproteobacteria bacterium]|nr:hypothetical protein [Gammaproteobacteria bacterium]